jgi:hypothetical protein
VRLRNLTSRAAWFGRPLCGKQSWLPAGWEARLSTSAISWGRLQSAEGFSPTFFEFVYSRWAVQKPEKFATHRKRRPERPPAGKIACHALRCAQAVGSQLSAVSSRAFAFPPGLEGSRAESSRRAKILRSSNTRKQSPPAGWKVGLQAGLPAPRKFFEGAGY